MAEQTQQICTFQIQNSDDSRLGRLDNATQKIFPVIKPNINIMVRTGESEKLIVIEGDKALVTLVTCVALWRSGAGASPKAGRHAACHTTPTYIFFLGCYTCLARRQSHLSRWDTSPGPTPLGNLALVVEARDWYSRD
jgi:hypothetical protein